MSGLAGTGTLLRALRNSNPAFSVANRRGISSVRNFLSNKTLAKRKFATRTVFAPDEGAATQKVESVWRMPKPSTLAYGGGGLLATFLAVEYTPYFKNTREGMAVAWYWKDLSPGEITEVAEAWVWQFWIGLAGLFGGASATRAALDKAVKKQYGSILMPFKIPLLVLGGVLGAKLTTSTAKPAAEFVIFAGRLAEFTIDGLLGDFMGKPRDDFSWVRKGVHSYSKSLSGEKKDIIEAVPYETRSDNVLRDLALVRGDISDPGKCGPYRHKLLLVRELGQLREQERVVSESQTESVAKGKFISQIEADKKRIKKMCQELYGVKIGRLYQEIQTEAAFKLEDLRAEQIALARAGVKLSDITKLDREKAKLKAQAKLALGVKLSTLTRPSPKWKTVFREVNAANQPA
jgi:hypothetical protein